MGRGRPPAEGERAVRPFAVACPLLPPSGGIPVASATGNSPVLQGGEGVGGMSAVGAPALKDGANSGRPTGRPRSPLKGAKEGGQCHGLSPGPPIRLAADLRRGSRAPTHARSPYDRYDMLSWKMLNRCWNESSGGGGHVRNGIS